MKFKSLASVGILSVSLFAIPSCKDSSESAAAAEDVKESVEESAEATSMEEMKDSAEETAEELTETAEAVVEDVEEKIDDAKAEGGSAMDGTAQKMMDATFEATEQYAEMMESIKDEESAKAALARFDDLGMKYEKIAEMAKSIDRTAISQEQGMEMQEKMMEKMQPLQERMQTSMVGAMQILGANPDLMKEFQERSMALAEKMTQMQQGQ